MDKRGVLGVELLNRLGGPVVPEEMDEQPDFIQWLRFLLYRQDFTVAVENAATLYTNKTKRPVIDTPEVLGFGG